MFLGRMDLTALAGCKFLLAETTTECASRRGETVPEQPQIIDITELPEDEFCPICHELINVRTPLKLHCGHIFCSSCIDKMRSHTVERYKQGEETLIDAHHSASFTQGGQHIVDHCPICRTGVRALLAPY